MATNADDNDIPVEKRLSGDFASPLEVLAAHGLSNMQKRSILHVWLRDLEKQPRTQGNAMVRDSILDALETLVGQEP